MSWWLARSDARAGTGGCRAAAAHRARLCRMAGSNASHYAIELFERLTSGLARDAKIGCTRQEEHGREIDEGRHDRADRRGGADHARGTDHEREAQRADDLAHAARPVAH